MTHKRKCQICGLKKPLTRDHVPPRALQIYLSSNDWSFADFLAGQGKPNFRQAGTWFRSICADCNSGALGAHFDPELVRISKWVILNIQSTIMMDSVRHVEYEPFAFCRAIIGHLLAARKKSMDTATDQLFRDYYWGARNDLGDFNIFYWVYKHPTRVVMRDFLFEYRGFCFGNLIKFFPLAFFVSNTLDFMERRSLASVISYQPKRKSKLVFDLRENLPELWPESPEYLGPIMMGESVKDAVVSKPNSKRLNRS